MDAFVKTQRGVEIRSDMDRVPPRRGRPLDVDPPSSTKSLVKIDSEKEEQTPLGLNNPEDREMVASLRVSEVPSTTVAPLSKKPKTSKPPKAPKKPKWGRQVAKVVERPTEIFD